MKKRKIFIAILAFIIIEISSFLFIEYLYKIETSNYLEEKTNELEVRQKAVQGAYIGMIQTIFSQIITKPRVLELCNNAILADSIKKNEIRDSLYNLLSPTYEQLKLTNVRQFIFILPNNKVLLRFHRLKKYDDDLTDVRYSVKTANATKQRQIGFEEGRTYTGFRNIFPIYYNNKHIGVIEISFSFAIRLLLEQDGGTYGLMIKKDIVDSKVSANKIGDYVSSFISDDYLHEKIFLHYNNDTLGIFKKIDKDINSKIAEQLANNESFSILHQINKANYIISFRSIINVEGNHVAYVFSYHKDEKVIAENIKKYFIMQVVLAILYAIITLIIIVVLLKKIKIKEILEIAAFERKKAEAEIKKLSIAVEQSANVIVITNIDGDIEYTNPKFTELTGYSAEEAHGQNPRILNAGTQEKEYYNKLWKTITAGKTWKGEFHNKKKNGEYFWEQVTITPIKNEEDEIINYLSIKEDFTARRNAEQTIKLNEERQKKILDTFKDGIYITTHDYKISYVNSVLRSKLGYNPIGKSCFKVMYNLQEKCSWCIYENLKIEERFEYEHKLESNKMFLVSNVVLKDGNKLTVLKDITDRKLAEETLKRNETELRKINATKDKFFSIIAHDLKSPFSSMLGFSRLLNEKFDEFKPEKQKKLLSYINIGIQNTYNLLEDLLLWSRSQRGSLGFNPEKLNLLILSNNVFELLKQLADKKNITLINEVSESAFVDADINMLSTILRNLLSNAIKFTEKGGQIKIKAQQRTNNNQQVFEITVEDTGVGISEQIQLKMFEIGESTSTKGTENEEGTGLGLILCKDFVEKHGGKIWVESKEGKGSSFIFTLAVLN